MSNLTENIFENKSEYIFEEKGIKINKEHNVIINLDDIDWKEEVQSIAIHRDSIRIMKSGFSNDSYIYRDTHDGTLFVKEVVTNKIVLG